MGTSNFKKCDMWGCVGFFVDYEETARSEYEYYVDNWEDVANVENYSKELRKLYDNYKQFIQWCITDNNTFLERC